jgi:hypothetical protein
MEGLPSPSETQPLLGTQNFNLDNPYPNLLSSEIEAKINVFCVHCGALELRNWQGKIIGNGLHASLTALYARIKHGFTFNTASIPLIGLWTVCLECCVELGLDRKPSLHFTGCRLHALPLLPPYWLLLLDFILFVLMLSRRKAN